MDRQQKSGEIEETNENTTTTITTTNAHRNVTVEASESSQLQNNPTQGSETPSPDDCDNHELATSDLEIEISCSSSGRSSRSNQPRVVELIQAQEHRPDTAETGATAGGLPDDGQPQNWTIGAEFYDEDIAQEALSDDDEDDDGDDGDDIMMNSPDEDEDDERESDFDEHDDDRNAYEFVDINEANPDLPYLEYRVPMRVINQHNRQAQLDLMVNGFVYADHDDYDTSDDNSVSSNVSANYDTALPAGHRYLGDNLEESRGRQVLLEGTIQRLPLINVRNVVLFPGQTIPISSSNQNYRIQQYLKACVEGRYKTIGFMSDPATNRIGTTAEIRNFSTNIDDEAEFSLIMEGRQRFKLVSSPFDMAVEGQVEILPEITLGPPYPRVSSHLRLLSSQSAAIAAKCVVSKHPYWLLRHYDGNYVIERIWVHLKDWSSGPSITLDHKHFSYWVAANLPISNAERMTALAFDSTEARLMWLLNLLEKCTYFGCSACKNKICEKSHVFPMSQLGPQCSFVNAGGYIHDTMTVIKATGIIQDRGWTTECTWFPGYAWRMAHCHNCSRHIGWCYKSEDPDTKPKKFFGLTRHSVRLQYEEPAGMQSNSWQRQLGRRVQL